MSAVLGQTETELDQKSTRVILAVGLIGAGIVMLGGEFVGGFGDIFWPFFVIVPGIALLAQAAGGGQLSKTLAVAGGVVTGTGLILFVQAVTDYFQSWAYAWTLLPVFAGAALFLIGRREGDQDAINRGRRLIELGAIGFVVCAAAFEALIFHRIVNQNWVLPIILIGAGAFLLLRRSSGSTSGNGKGTPPPAPT